MLCDHAVFTVHDMSSTICQAGLLLGTDAGPAIALPPQAVLDRSLAKTLLIQFTTTVKPPQNWH